MNVSRRSCRCSPVRRRVHRRVGRFVGVVRLRDNGSIPVWTVAGPLPNAAAVSHGENCFGYYKDYLQAAGGERRAMPTDQDRIVFDHGKHVTWKQAFSDPFGLARFYRHFRRFEKGPVSPTPSAGSTRTTKESRL